MEKLVVSACLLGCNCRYDGKNCHVEGIEKLAENFVLIPVCPEQMGGLSTPRIPAERIGDKVINREGADVTAQYQKGAQMALQIAKINDVKCALFKSKSPSCGKGIIYDGTFTGALKEGNGVTASIFEENGIEVYSDEQICDFIHKSVDKSDL
ncbi:MAG: DUF523 domain-containing protein [Solobacterium sp.]|nr:DUF523 domain-containing protein [Solobacterium sp.]